jgi:lipopolysaccharide biosynthesis regulator YciM
MGSEALEKLVGIYEREREWQKAVDVGRELELLSGEKSNRIAHYYCELAEAARVAGDLDLARSYLKSSIRSESGALRGLLIRAAIAEEEQDHAQAVRLFEQVIEADRRFIPEVLPSLVSSYRVIGRQVDLESFLDRLIERDPTHKRDLAYAAILGSINDSVRLSECVREFVLHDEVLVNFIDPGQLEVQMSVEANERFQRILAGLRKLALKGARYRCSNCGYGTQRLIWHCPSCKSWESIHPVKSFQFEGLVA